MFLDLKKKIVHLLEVFLIFAKKLWRAESQKPLGGFSQICTAGTSKLVDVQCKFMFESDHNILSYSHFKILAQAYPRWGDGIDPEFFVSSLYISVAIKGRLLKFNMFNRYKINISKLVLIFPNFIIVDLK